MHVVMHLRKHVDVNTFIFSSSAFFFFFASSEKVGKVHLQEGCISYSEHVATWKSLTR